MHETINDRALNHRPVSRAAATRTSWRYDLISAALAFVLWGAWAYYLNRAGVGAGSGEAKPWVSGLTQGTSSFLATLVMVRAVAWLYHHMSHFPASLVLPAVIVVSVTGACLVSAHVMVGTPNIVGTIAPALSMAFAFNVFTTAKLQRVNREFVEGNGAGERS